MMEASVESVFVQDARCFTCRATSLHVPAVAALPGGGAGGSLRRQPHGVADGEDRVPRRDRLPGGIDKFIELVRRRVRDLSRVFGDDLDATLLPIVYASGGYPRDLLRMVRQILIDAPVFP